MADWISREEDFERKPKKKLIHRATPICVANERTGVPIQTMADWNARGEDFGSKPKKKLSGWVLSGANCRYEDAASFSVFNHRRSVHSEGKPIPTELKNEEAELRREIDLQDENCQ